MTSRIFLEEWVRERAYLLEGGSMEFSTNNSNPSLIQLKHVLPRFFRRLQGEMADIFNYLNMCHRTCFFG